MKKTKSLANFDEYYSEIVNVFDKYDKLNPEEFKQFIYDF